MDESIRALNVARRLSYGEQLARRARKEPNERALRFEGVDRSVGELDERVTRLANALAARGVVKGDRVATLGYNAMEIIETYLASSRLGAICVPINFRLVPTEISYIAENSGAKALVVDAQMAEAAGKVRETVTGITACLVVSDDASAAGPGAEVYETVLAEASTEPPNIDVSEFDPAFIMYTSGTTGRPKGAVLSHWNLLMNTFNIISLMGMSSGETFLSGLPLFHIGGLNLISPQLLLGGTNVVLANGDFSAEKVVDMLEAEEVTGCYFVPTQWQQICAVPGIKDRKFNLRRIMWGASVAPPSVLKAMEETFPGVPTYNCFGQTEMSSVTCVLMGEDAISKQGSVGKAIANVEARLVDEDMNDVPQGEPGEIVYRGPTVMQGYWNNPEATADAFEGGWFHSGDLVREDEDGYMFVVDRKKDMIISGGENIYCAEVEAVIDAHPKVREVAIVGVPHEKWVETPVAVISATDAADPPSQEEIIAWCRERLASYKKPSQVFLVDELPRNASGKILKFQLRESYSEQPVGQG
ncbi:MAG TPA: long-chain-fatty-acid--CoA ligase [Baekduia sp.]|jgi:O-succinylbenzoate-CoA ligase